MTESRIDTWNVSENEYDKLQSRSDKIRFLLKYAILAPSSHNTQPWIFKLVRDNIVELYADRTRALPVVDPEDRELIISCGAALNHLEIALKHFGYNYKTEIFLKTGDYDKDLLARVTLEGGGRSQYHAAIHKEEDPLFDAITKRRTNRSKFEDRRPPGYILNELKTGTSQQNSIWLEIADGEQKKRLADLIAEGDRIQMSDKRFRRELSSWTHSNRSHSGDGIPGYAFGYSDFMSHLGPFVIRTFDIGKGQAANDRELASDSPVLAVLGSNSDEPTDWLTTGLAIGRLLLRAQSHNIWSSFLNQPIEVQELRSEVRAAVDKEEGFPQVLLRMGYGKEVRPTPRRSVAEVLH